MQESKCVINMASLQSALKKTKGTIACQDVQVLLRNYLIKGEAKTGRVTFVATDLDLASKGVCQASVSNDFTVAIPGDKLVRIAELSSAEAADFIVQGDNLNIKVGNFECKLLGLPPQDFPPLPDFSKEDSSVVSKEIFLSHLKRISFSINDNAVKKNLLAVHLSQGFIQASDGRVTSMCACALSGVLDKLLIPAMAVPALIVVLRESEEKEVQICEGEAFIIFKLGDAEFLARKSTALFPDVLRLVAKPTETVKELAVFDKSSFSSAVQRVAIAADEKSLGITLKLNAKAIELSAIDLAGNTALEKIQAVWNGEDGISYRFNYTYLVDIMSSIQADTVKIKVSPSLKIPVRFEDSDFLCFLMRLAK